MEQQKIQLGEVGIMTYRMGKRGAPTLVFSHGITDSGLCWLRFAREFSHEYDILLYDCRGHGDSDKPKTGYTITDHTSDLLRLLEAMSINKPILIGHSMGASIVSTLAASHPDIPKALILEDPVHLSSRDQAYKQPPAERMAAIRQEILARNRMSVSELEQLCETRAHPGWAAEEVHQWAIAKQKVSPDIAETFQHMPVLDELFRRIKCPTLILKADADPQTKQENERVASLLEKGQMVHVSGAGHNVRRDRFAQSVQLVQQFLKSLADL